MVRWPLLLLGATAIGWSDPIASEQVHRPIRGSEWPDGVLALTYDDGPDANTLKLADLLRDHHVRATFFVVEAWTLGVSEEPGNGATKFDTGYAKMPILEGLVERGHRVGSHTRNHALLGHATRSDAHVQIGSGPFLGTDLHMFRAPAGWWTAESTAAFADRDDLIGPFHWDIDGKDWECSLYCRSDAPANECEPGPVGPRVRPAVIAGRYFAQIEAAKHGIVLFHDRVGDVGSTFALDVATALIPRLEAAGYVFAAPVLNFGRLVPDDGAAASADINGDGRADVCRSTPRGVECELGGAKAPSIWWPTPLADFRLADANHDGRADLCFDGHCALAP